MFPIGSENLFYLINKEILIFYNFSKVLERFLDPLINFFENIGDVVHPLINSFKGFLEYVLNIDRSGKKLPSWLESLLRRNHDFYKLLPEPIQKDVKSDLNLFLYIYDLLIHFSPLILVLMVVFFWKFIKTLVFVAVVLVLNLFIFTIGRFCTAYVSENFF